jgi:import inner membrane translocase subunit TIM54
MIFWTIVGSWSAAVYYDRREKKRIQKKWCDAVAHLAREPLPTNVMQRKLTVFLSAPPADGLLNAREHFHEYVRPILASAGLNWDAIEGRREGDVRAAFAEWLRKRRKVAGEGSAEPVAEDDLEVMIESMRDKMNVKEWSGPAGDIIIGRNTWKEYVRGLHEGWLGPVDTPEHVRQALEETDKPAELQTSAEETSTPIQDTPSPSGDALPPTDDSIPTSEGNVIHDSEVSRPDEEKKEPEKPKEEDKSKKPKQPPPFISTTDYASASLPPSLPAELPPTTVINFPHLLGFLNTPIRIYRYLNKRKVADDVGREVVAACFAAYRPFERKSGVSASSVFAEDDASPSSAPHQEEADPASAVEKEGWEQEQTLKFEEKDWHKSVRKNHDPTKESVWVDGMVLDPRIAGRMRRFYLDEADVERGLALEEARKREEEAGKAEKESTSS